jgi:protein arginine N-methyltransferase 1
VSWKARDLAAARVEGFALWWEAELVEGITLSTSPFAPTTHWQQIYLPLLHAHDLHADDELELTLASDTRPEVGVRVGWTSRQRRRGKTIAEQSLDSLRGQL